MVFGFTNWGIISHRLQTDRNHPWKACKWRKAGRGGQRECLTGTKWDCVLPQVVWVKSSQVWRTRGEVRGCLDKSSHQPHFPPDKQCVHLLALDNNGFCLILWNWVHQPLDSSSPFPFAYIIFQIWGFSGQLVPLLLNQGPHISFQLLICDLAVSALLHPGNVCLLNY